MGIYPAAELLGYRYVYVVVDMPNIFPKRWYPGGDVVGARDLTVEKDTYKYGMGDSSIEPCGDGFEFEVV